MTSPIRRRLLTLALCLVAAGWASGPALASAAVSDPTSYSLVGTVSSPTGSAVNPVYYNGNTGSVAPGDTSINLGQFVVSTLAQTSPATYNQTPFQIIASVGSNSASQFNGVLNGQVGPGVTNPSLTATFTGIKQYGNNPLPFVVNLPIGTALPLALSSGTTAQPTGLIAPLTVPTPEPASIAIFAVALGGLGLWRRRAGR